ncbi:MAG: 5-formyltetrahydrofolate cyclo-ligase [Lachnospira sp.]
MDKKQIRRYIKEKKEQLSKAYIEKESRRIFEKLYSLLEFKNEENIFSYVSYNQEVDTYPFISHCMELGKNVFVPKVITCDGQNNDMEFFNITSMDELVEGYKGIMEPIEGTAVAPDDIPGLMIMPGLAFDEKLNRVGYGGGFYDRYIESHPKLKKVAVCFDFQILNEVCHEEFDMKPDMIISENRILRGE